MSGSISTVSLMEIQLFNLFVYGGPMKRIIASALVLISSASTLAQNTTVTTTAPTTAMPWTATLKSEVSSNLETAKQIGGALTETQLRLAYKFNDVAQLGLLLGGKYNVANDSQNQADQDLISSDAAIAGIYVAPAILGADKTQIDGRLYVPTSEASKIAKQQALMRADILLPYTLEQQRSVSLLVSPRYTDYQQTASKLELVSQAKLAQGKMIAPYLALNHKLKLVDATAGLTRAEELMGPELGVEIVPHKLVKLSLLVSQERNILNPTAKKASANYSAFNTTETKYLVGAQIKL